MSNYCDSVLQYLCIITTPCWELVVFIVCCHFISLYYLPREGSLLLLQAVQKALSRLFLSFCKDNHFFWESILFLLFFFAPTFVTFAPTFVTFAVMIVAFGPAFVAFAPMILLSYSSFECLPPASFWFHLAVGTLAIGYTIPAIRAC